MDFFEKTFLVFVIHQEFPFTVPQNRIPMQKPPQTYCTNSSLIGSKSVDNIKKYHRFFTSTKSIRFKQNRHYLKFQ